MELPVNRLETLPRELLINILERMHMRDLIRALNTLDTDIADYLCPREHKREFKPALDEIAAIQHTIGIKLVTRWPDVGYTSFEKTTRVRPNSFIRYELNVEEKSLSVFVGDARWPVKIMKK